MKVELIGRKEEQEILGKAMSSPEAEMITSLIFVK